MLEKLPKQLVDRLKSIYSKDELEIIHSWFSCEKRKTSFRVNTLKTTCEEIEWILDTQNLEYEKSPFLKNGYILLHGVEKDLWDLDIFTDWKIYLQSLSSQIPVDILDLNQWENILDITAAPGGKTSQASAYLNNTWKIIANDNNQIRIDKLKFTLERQWCKNVEVIKSDARNIWKDYEDFTEYFDHIIADVPCSAEWKINIHREKSYWFWNEWIIKKNYKLQKQIIKSIIPLLKQGWSLVYSTCTLAPEENEAMVHMILSNYPELEIQDIQLDYQNTKPWILKFWKQCFRKEVSKSMRILPTDETEWFFVAIFKKRLD